MQAPYCKHINTVIDVIPQHDTIGRPCLHTHAFSLMWGTKDAFSSCKIHSHGRNITWQSWGCVCLDGGIGTHPANVISPEINQHDMLSPLLLISQKILFQRPVCLRRLASRPGASQRPARIAAVSACTKLAFSSRLVLPCPVHSLNALHVQCKLPCGLSLLLPILNGT